MIIRNVRYVNSDFQFTTGDIAVCDGKFCREAAPDDKEILDMTGLTALPGFVDIHSHGGSGCDFCDGKEESLSVLSRHYARHGVTSLCPTTMTFPYDKIETVLRAVEAFKGREPGAYFHGINMEGPFISKEKCGAQDPQFAVAPDADFLRKMQKITEISLVDVAPETEGACDFARQVKDSVTVSLAHTNADYDCAIAAIDSGFSHATHFLNAMTPFLSRAPGVAGAVLESDSVTAELICDGYHLAPATLRILFKLLGDDRTVVISDSMSSADCPDGDYVLGGQKVIVSGGKAHLADGTIAGSTTNLFDEFQNLLSFGIPFLSALKSCTINPARVIGKDNICGSIAPGKNADLLIVDEDMKLRRVMIRGKFIDL